MTGKEKLIDILLNHYNLISHSICPSDFGMDNNCVLSCSQCWQQVLEKEYPDDKEADYSTCQNPIAFSEMNCEECRFADKCTCKAKGDYGRYKI